MEKKNEVLSENHPHIQLFWQVVPAWHGESSDELDTKVGEGYCCGFASGFERGIIAAMLRPEWAQGFYRQLRHYYLKTHSEDDLRDWDKHADATARAMPVREYV